MKPHRDVNICRKRHIGEQIADSCFDSPYSGIEFSDRDMISRFDLATESQRGESCIQLNIYVLSTPRRASYGTD